MPKLIHIPEVLKSNYTFGQHFDSSQAIIMDLATLNLIRKGNGQEPLEALPVDLGGPAPAGETKTAEQKEAERLEAERVEAERVKAEADKNKVGGTVDLTDDELMAILKKRGAVASSIEELLKPAEIADPVKAAEKREADELAYGLTNGLFNRQEYDNFVSDMKDVNNLVYAEFYADTKEGNPELKDDEIQAEFLSQYGLDKEKDSYQFKRGLKQIKERAKALVQGKHSKIIGAKDAFSKNEQTTKAATETQKKIATALPGYRQDVETTIAELKKLTIPFAENENLELDVAEEDLSAIKADLLTPEYYGKLLSGEYSKDGLKQTIVAGFLAKNFTKLTVAVAKKYLDAKKAGTQGIPVGGGGAAKVVEFDPSKFTEAQKKMIELQNADKAKAQ